MVHGLQLLRGALASFSVSLGQVRDVDAGILVGAIFVVFLSGFAAPLIKRVFGARRGLLILAAALVFLRLAEQLSGTVDVRLAAEVAGVVVWLCFLPLAVIASFGRLPSDSCSVGPSRETAGASPLIGILLGLTLDTAMKGAFGTLDPGFSSGLPALLATLGLGGVQLALALWLWRYPTDEQIPDQPPVSAFCLGAALALHTLIFQNLAHHSVLIGWNLPAVSAWVLAGNTLALLVALGLSRHGSQTPRWLTLLAAAALIACAAPAPDSVAAAVIALVAPAATTALLASAFAPGGAEGRGWFATGLGLLAIPLILIGWYAHYEIEVPVAQPLFPLIGAALVVIAVGSRLRRPATDSATASRVECGFAADSMRSQPAAAGVLALALLLGLFPLYQQVAWKSPAPAADNPTQLRLTTYNIHQGFDLDGLPSLEQIADVLESHQPDVIALQEVPRGWVVNGSVDALSWLAQRLEMHSAWGPAADDFWGNAVLSRFPIVAVEHRPMPNNSAIRFNRAYLLVTLDVQGLPIHVVATHLHHIQREPQHRLPQVIELIEEVDWSRPTILLGDLNAQQHHLELRMLLESDLQTSAIPVPTFPSNRARRQIDHILWTDHFTLSEFGTISTTASDHLPLTAVLSESDDQR
jgi:endonuclease/exonuclease/phosphatase family metal-dependent hydrolase